MTSAVVKISFLGATPGEAGNYAQELEEVLREFAPEVKAKRQPSQADTLNLGDTLIAVLPFVPDAIHISATVALSLVEGIHVWMLHQERKQPRANNVVELEGKGGAKVQLDQAALDQMIKALQVLGVFQPK